MINNLRTATGRPLQSVAVVLAAALNGIGVVRSLAKKQIRSIVVCTSSRDPAYLSRLPIQKILIPADTLIRDWLPVFIDDIARDADCIIPTSDEFASVLRQLSPDLQGLLPVALPPREIVDSLNDKRTEIDLMRRNGIPMPASLTDIALFDEHSLRFPIIIKPRSFAMKPILRAKNRIIENVEGFAAFASEFSAHLDAFIAQEIIPGDESYQWVCNATFDKDARMVAAFSFQRLGTRPSRYGVTTLAVSRHHPEVKRMCREIGDTLRYVGPAMFEFKVDPRSGEYCYIETNPRLGMCNWYDASCGVNNAYNAYAIAAGLPPDINLDQQQDGVLYLDLLGDFYTRLQARQDLKSIVSRYYRLRKHRVVRPAWSVTDPIPGITGVVDFVLEVIRMIGRKVRKLVTRRGPV